MKSTVLLSMIALTVAGTASARQHDVFRKANSPLAGRTVVDPHFAQERYAKKSIMKAQELPQGTVLYEDFEEWDGTDAWTPEGWKFDHKVTPAGHPGWKVYPYDAYDPVNYPSNAYIYLFFEDTVDEWLISPEFVPDNGMVFSADCFNAGTYYYNIDAEMFTSNINSIEKVNDFIIHITTDGGKTWTPLYSIPDEMSKLGYTKAYEYWDRHGYETIVLSLDEYAGKTCQIAFQIVGEPESESAAVDNISVGYPKVDVSYSRPEGALFFGLTDTDLAVPGTFMVVPVHHPVTYPNTSAGRGAEYFWSYEHTEGELTSSNKHLTVTYGTNHESEYTSRNNVYSTPVLTGKADKMAETSFSLPGFVQAGGRGEYEIRYTDQVEGQPDSEWLQLGLTVADPFLEGTSTCADITVPYFGYNQESDRYWTCKAFDITSQEYDKNYRGDKNNWSHLESYANFFYNTTGAPIVIEGIRTNGYGRGYGLNGTFSSDAEFTAEIYLIDDDFVVSETPAYSKTIKGNQVKVINRNASNHILTFNFPFEEPVVINPEDCQAYLVAIRGFRDPDFVDYFSPELSAYDNPDGLALGWIGRVTCWGGFELPMSWTPIFYTTEQIEPGGEQLRSFFIMLDAVYPWLEAETTEADVKADAPTVIKLDSYYQGRQLTVEGLPSSLSAQLSGRYGDATLTLTALEDKVDPCQIVITGPGVRKAININGFVSGIDSVVDKEGNGPIEYYNLQGIRIAKPEKGQLLIKRQGNKTEKIIVK